MSETPVTIPQITQRKGRGSVVMVTAYDAPSARLCDAAGVDLLLVGDSLAMVVLGHPNTLAVTMEEMLHHTRAVARGSRRALVVADMPYLSYQVSVRDGVANAGRFIKEAGAQAVKIEGGANRVELVRALLDAEIPVMGHVGLTPQSYHRFGGFRVQGREAVAAERVMADARALADAGVFSIVIEAVPAALGAAITTNVPVPTVGIGAGADTDGQVLVFHDLLGLSDGRLPRFVRRYAEVGRDIQGAVARFVSDVREGAFPSPGECYGDEPKVGSPSPLTTG